MDLGRSVNKGYSTRMNPQANGRRGGTTGTRKNGQRASGPSSSDGLGGRSGGLSRREGSRQPLLDQLSVSFRFLSLVLLSSSWSGV